VLNCALVCRAWYLSVEPILLSAAHILEGLNDGAYEDTVLWDLHTAQMGQLSWRRVAASPFRVSSVLTPLIPDVLFDLAELSSRFSVFRALPNCWRSGVLYFDAHGILQTLNVVGTLFNRRSLFAGPTLETELEWLYRLREHLDDGCYNGLCVRSGLAPCLFASAAVLCAQTHEDTPVMGPFAVGTPWPQFETATGPQFLATLGLHLHGLQNPWSTDPPYRLTRLLAPFPKVQLEALLDLVVTKRQAAFVAMFGAQMGSVAQLNVGLDPLNPLMVLYIGRLKSTGSLVGFLLTVHT
jgi:hypothetical protein